MVGRRIAGAVEQTVDATLRIGGKVRMNTSDETGAGGPGDLRSLVVRGVFFWRDCAEITGELVREQRRMGRVANDFMAMMVYGGSVDTGRTG